MSQEFKNCLKPSEQLKKSFSGHFWNLRMLYRHSRVEYLNFRKCSFFPYVESHRKSKNSKRKFLPQNLVKPFWNRFYACKTMSLLKFHPVTHLFEKTLCASAWRFVLGPAVICRCVLLCEDTWCCHSLWCCVSLHHNLLYDHKLVLQGLILHSVASFCTILPPAMTFTRCCES